MRHREIIPPCYETRYRHKLNMLWPGEIMIKIIGVLLGLGGMLFIINWFMPAYIVFLLAGVTFTILLILVTVELHQDRVLNEIAMRENKKEK